MVLKLTRKINSCVFWFESDVISDGTQTFSLLRIACLAFESDVISDGTQTQIYSAKGPFFVTEKLSLKNSKNPLAKTQNVW